MLTKLSGKMEIMKDSLNDDLIQKNIMYCIIIKNDYSIEEKFEKYCASFLDSDDNKFLFGGDGDNFDEKTIYLTFLDRYKIDKLILFFKEHDILIFFKEVKSLTSLICSDEKYLDLYNDEDNKSSLDNYIRYHVYVDDVLDRLANEKLDFSDLLPIELEILENI